LKKKAPFPCSRHRRWPTTASRTTFPHRESNAIADTSYEYGKTNYALLGPIAEKARGRPLGQQLQDRLFGPLGLQQTFLPVADDTAIPGSALARLHVRRVLICDGRQAVPADVQAGTVQPIDYTNENPSYVTAAGGTISTADNMATWIKAMVSGIVFNVDYQQQWLQSLQPEDPNRPDRQQYGYGNAPYNHGARNVGL
jgi:D-alanyl-D-alanine carboxypeptidase